jgi:hypothetical protein
VSKTADEQLLDEVEAIQLNMFDIVINNDENWFTKAIEKEEENA